MITSSRARVTLSRTRAPYPPASLARGNGVSTGLICMKMKMQMPASARERRRVRKCNFFFPSCSPPQFALETLRAENICRAHARKIGKVRKRRSEEEEEASGISLQVYVCVCVCVEVGAEKIRDFEVRQKLGQPDSRDSRTIYTHTHI